MVAYSFQQRFEAPIVADTKLQTIRLPRKRHAQAGEDLQLYVGMRTKNCRLIGRRRALSAHNVVIDVIRETISVECTFPACRTGQAFDYTWGGQQARLAPILDLDDFAVRDGFADWKDMRTFWLDAHVRPATTEAAMVFHGVVIRWAPGELVHLEAFGVAPIARELEALGL